MFEREYSYVFTTVESHTVGEPTRIITSGFPECPEGTMMEKKQYLEEHYDHLRSALMCEPRGHKDMVGAIILPKCHKEADLGVVFMDAKRWVNMCGHATIGCATFAVEAKLVPVYEPYTAVVIDTPAGIIPTKVKVEKDRAVEVTICNIPSFLYQENIKVEVDDKSYDVSISFGGTFFALIDAEQLQIQLHAEDIKYLIPFTKKLLNQINKQWEVKHPYLKISRVVNAEFYLSMDKNSQKSIVIAEEGQVDRSPCGTGTSAKIAYLYATGGLSAKEIYVNESFTGAKFRGMFEELATIGSFSGIRPLITGSAYIMGQASYFIDEKDPLTYGFSL